MGIVLLSVSSNLTRHCVVVWPKESMPHSCWLTFGPKTTPILLCANYISHKSLLIELKKDQLWNDLHHHLAWTRIFQYHLPRPTKPHCIHHPHQLWTPRDVVEEDGRFKTYELVGSPMFNGQGTTGKPVENQRKTILMDGKVRVKLEWRGLMMSEADVKRLHVR